MMMTMMTTLLLLLLLELGDLRAAATSLNGADEVAPARRTHTADVRTGRLP
jgi:hypothetical protein